MITNTGVTVFCIFLSASYSQYPANQSGSSPSRYSPSASRPSEEGGVTYAQIADTGVTYAQVLPRSDRPVPGPQMPIQVKVQESKPLPQSTYLSPSMAQYQR